VLQDKEGVDFKYYFTNKYQLTHLKQHDERGGRGRGRGGRGRGGRNEGERDEQQEETKVIEVTDKDSLKFQETPENKLALMFQFLYKYINQKFNAGAYDG
jgi:hypothetical protein